MVVATFSSVSPMRSSSNHWSTERWRLTGVIGFGLLAGLLTNQWWLCLVIALCCYIGWMLYQLQGLLRWVEKGGKSSLMPDSKGIWEVINFHIHSSYLINQRADLKTSALLERMEKIITSLPFATVVLTKHNLIDWVSNQSESLLHINLEQDRGQPIENLLRVSELYELLQNNQAQVIEITSPHNEQLKLAIHLVPIQADMKLLIARDISDRTRIQQIRNNFIANASHELRTPLTVISGYLEMMDTDADLSNSTKQAVKASIQQSNRMKNLINDLIALSRWENTEPLVNDCEAVNMHQLITNLVNDASDNLFAENKQQQIDVSKVNSALFLQGVPVEIDSVCSNLINNAIAYTDSDSTINITWQLIATGEAMLSVRDNGQGIPNIHIPHLTERFYRVDEARSQATGGSGLGLTIVKHIANRHGGTLTIRSVIGRGSKFTIIFPANRVIQQVVK